VASARPGRVPVRRSAVSTVDKRQWQGHRRKAKNQKRAHHSGEASSQTACTSQAAQLPDTPRAGLRHAMQALPLTHAIIA